MKFLTKLALALVCASVPFTAQAAQYRCDAMGDGSYTIILSKVHDRVGWAIYRLEGDMAFMAGEEVNGITLTLIEEGDDYFYDAVDSGVQFWPVDHRGTLFADGEQVDCVAMP